MDKICFGNNSICFMAFLELDTAGSLTLNYLARFCCAGIEVIYYTYSIELYPTPVRSLAFGINATFGDVGSIGASYLLEFLKNWQFLTLFGVVCSINAVVLVCIPETVGKPMIESIKELSEENNIDNIEDNINNVANNKKEEADDFSLHIREDNNNEEKTEDMKEKHEN